MRSVSGFLWLLLTFGMILGACSKEESSEAFSDLGVEKDKQNIESDAVALVHDLRALSNTKFANVGVEIIKMLNSQPVLASNKLIGSVAQMGYAMGSEKPVDEQFAVLKSMALNQDGIFSALWQEGVGVWEWSDEYGDFVKTENSENEVIYKFPATINSETNNATIRLYDFKVFTGEFPGKGEILEDGTVINEMIQELYFSMHVDEELIATSNIINYFSPEGYFEDVSITFNPLPYSFNAELGETQNGANWHFIVSNGDELILKHEMRATASDDMYAEFPIETIETSLRIKSIELHGNINAKPLLSVMEDVEAKMYSDVELSDAEVKVEMEKLATAINKYASLKLRYADGGIIAKAHANVVEGEDTYMYYDSQTGQFVEKTEFVWEIGLLLEFSDGSMISLDTFFEQNFDRFMEEMEAFMIDLNERLELAN